MLTFQKLGDVGNRVLYLSEGNLLDNGVEREFNNARFTASPLYYNTPIKSTQPDLIAIFTHSTP
jgi:hypothetical protein